MRRRAASYVVSAAALVAGALGCQAAGGAPDATVADAGADAVVAVVDASPDARARDAAREAAGPTCVARPDGGSTIACVRQVIGAVVDLADAPLGGIPVVVCGAACFYAQTAMDGAFAVAPDADLDVARYGVSVQGRPDYASLYVPMPFPVDGVVALPAALRVPRYTDVGPPMPDGATGGTVTAGDVTLTVPPGTTLEFDLMDDALGELGTRFRVAPVPPAQAPQFAAEAGGLVSVYALAPFNLAATQRLGVRVANRAGLAAGAAVEFVVMGRQYVEGTVDVGRPLVAATGRVSADGTTVATDAGEGLRFLTWFGLRLRDR